MSEGLTLWDPATADRAEVLMEYAGAGDDDASLDLVRQTTHDLVLATLRERGLTQAGPVEWWIYRASKASSMLVAGNLADHPNAAGLVEFLQQPKTVLVVTTVSYLRHPEPVARRGRP